MSSTKKIKINVILFYFCYIVILAATMFRYVTGIGDFLQKIYQPIIYVLLLVGIMNMEKITKKKILVLFLLAFLVMITKYISGTNTILLLCLSIIAFKDIDFDKFVKFDIRLKIPFTIIVSIFYFLGLTAVNIHYRDGIIRHSMGFSNPNVFSNYILAIVVEYLYLHRKKLKLRDILMILIGIFFIDFYADSRTQIMCIALLSAMLLTRQYVYKTLFENKIFKFIVRNSFLIMFILSLSLIQLYKAENEHINSINSFVSERISTSTAIYDQYGINLFGHKLELVTSLESKLTGKKAIALDNLYIYILLSYGVLSVLAFYIFTYKYMKYVFKRKEYVIGVIMFSFFIGGMMERFCIEIVYNIFLLYFSYILYGNKKSITTTESQEKLEAAI